MRAQNKRDVQRRTEFHAAGAKQAMDRLREEVIELLKGWERVQERGKDLYHPFHQSREHLMLQHFMQWQARTIYHLFHLRFMSSTSPTP
jgi:hypothetical protein